MKILAVDTAGTNCSLCLAIDEQHYFAESTERRMHTKRLLPLLDDLIQQAGIALADLDFITFTKGPGSFTGLRIGASMVQGLAFAHELSVLPISTLELLAFANLQVGEEGAVVLDARMGESFYGAYRRTDNGVTELLKPCKIVLADLNKDAYPNLIVDPDFEFAHNHKLAQADAKDLIALAEIKYPNAILDSAELAQPEYLHIWQPQN